MLLIVVDWFAEGYTLWLMKITRANFGFIEQLAAVGELLRDYVHYAAFGFDNTFYHQ